MKQIIFTLVIVFFSIEIYSQDEKQKDSLKTSEHIIIYGSDSCHYCIDTKTFLKDNNVPFTFYDIDKNELKLNELLNKLTKKGISLSNLSFPIVDKDGSLIMNNTTFKNFLQKLLEH